VSFPQLYVSVFSVHFAQVGLTSKLCTKRAVKGPVAMAASKITSSKQRGLTTIYAIGQLSPIAIQNRPIFLQLETSLSRRWH